MIDDENIEQTETTNGPIEERTLEKNNERGGKKGRVKGPCEVLSSEPYVNVEIVKFGRDPNVSYSSGNIFTKTHLNLILYVFLYYIFTLFYRNYSKGGLWERLWFESRL